MSEIYFVSDMHFGHRSITKYRSNFSSSKEHDEVLLKNILECGGKKNVLWMLGDCFFEESTLDYLRTLRPKFQKIHFVVGNHDTETTERQKMIRQILVENLVDNIGSLFRKYGMWISHHPIHPDELRGYKNIHGHVHNCTIPDDRYINACPEANSFSPISLSWLRDNRI